MTPIIEVSNNVLKDLDQLEIPYNLKNKALNFNRDDFIYVPSINLYVAKERTHLNKNWDESHKFLQEQENKMLTIPEFTEFLKYLKNSNNKEYWDIYKDITEVRKSNSLRDIIEVRKSNSLRAEWLDADFKVKNNKLHINSNHVLDSNGKIINYNSEPLDKNTLMKDKTPGISLEDWINNPTRQGLPNKKTKSGDLCYWYPRSDDNSVAGFCVGSGGAGFGCGRGPSGRDSYLGVRAVRHASKVLLD